MTGRDENAIKAVKEAAGRIRAILPESSVAENEPMSLHTSFRTGGPAYALITCCSEEELAGVLKICSETEGAAHMLIGNGSNLLVSDEGYPGIMIKLGGSFGEVSISGDPDGRNTDDHVMVRAGAARLLSSVSAFLTEHGLSGMEFASGIPGSMGGAVFMNAGAYGGEMKDIVSSVKLMKQDGTEITELGAEEMDFGYRHSMVQDSGLIVLSADMVLTPDDPEAIAARVHELQEKRNAKQPVNYPSAGSTFKRPAGGYAAALIDDAGLKGFSIGGAMVSEKHAGFVINTGGATTADVLAVMRHVREAVWEKSGIMLEPEVRLINCSL